jgi:hypothetical protein
VIALLLLLATQDVAPPPAEAAPATPSVFNPPSDTDPPIIEDVAAASSNPRAAPAITVMMSDRGTGIGSAFVIYRQLPSGEWQKAELKGGTTGLFIARLPAGLLVSGFEYYIEASDIAGNGPARIASALAPIRVERATQATTDRLREEREAVNVGPAIHPAFLMLSLGVGVLAGAGAGAYALDLASIGSRIGDVDTELATGGLSDTRRAELLAARGALETAQRGDLVITSILGIVAVAGLGTGVTLVVLSATE